MSQQQGFAERASAFLAWMKEKHISLRFAAQYPTETTKQILLLEELQRRFGELIPGASIQLGYLSETRRHYCMLLPNGQRVAVYLLRAFLRLAVGYFRSRWLVVFGFPKGGGYYLDGLSPERQELIKQILISPIDTTQIEIRPEIFVPQEVEAQLCTEEIEQGLLAFFKECYGEVFQLIKVNEFIQLPLPKAEMKPLLENIIDEHSSVDVNFDPIRESLPYHSSNEQGERQGGAIAYPHLLRDVTEGTGSEYKALLEAGVEFVSLRLSYFGDSKYLEQVAYQLLVSLQGDPIDLTAMLIGQATGGEDQELFWLDVFVCNREVYLSRLKAFFAKHPMDVQEFRYLDGCTRETLISTDDFTLQELIQGQAAADVIVERCERLGKAKSQTLEVALAQAKSYLRLGMEEEVLELLEPWANEEQDNAQIHFVLGLAKLKLCELRPELAQEASEHFSAQLTLEPEGKDVGRAYLALAQLHMGLLPEGLLDYDIAMQCLAIAYDYEGMQELIDELFLLPSSPLTSDVYPSYEASLKKLYGENPHHSVEVFHPNGLHYYLDWYQPSVGRPMHIITTRGLADYVLKRTAFASDKLPVLARLELTLAISPELNIDKAKLSHPYWWGRTLLTLTIERLIGQGEILHITTLPQILPFEDVTLEVKQDLLLNASGVLLRNPSILSPNYSSADFGLTIEGLHEDERLLNLIITPLYQEEVNYMRYLCSQEQKSKAIFDLSPIIIKERLPIIEPINLDTINISQLLNRRADRGAQLDN